MRRWSRERMCSDSVSRRSFDKTCGRRSTGSWGLFGLRFIHGRVEQVRDSGVWDGPSHHWLRLTRVLRSLVLLGCPDEALALYRFLEQRVPAAPSMSYWRDAVRPQGY